MTLAFFRNGIDFADWEIFDGDIPSILVPAWGLHLRDVVDELALHAVLGAMVDGGGVQLTEWCL